MAPSSHAGRRANASRTRWGSSASAGPCSPARSGAAGGGVLRAFRIGVYALSVTGVVYLSLAGSSFYLTPLLERARHPGYWVWKPGGSAGHTLGIVGSLMMTLMLLYSVRKRVKLFRRLGPLSNWLDVHIYLGIFGPALVILHSSFKVSGLVALSFWSMLAVAASGAVGRYLYLQIPRTRAGDALSLAALEKLDEKLSEQLRTRFRLSDSALERLEELAAPPAARAGLARALVEVALGDLRLRPRLRDFARRCRGVPAPLLRQLQQVIREKAVTHRRLLLWDALHELFFYWHVLHKPFAVVMYLFMVLHVAVAMMTGYGWGGGL